MEKSGSHEWNRGSPQAGADDLPILAARAEQCCGEDIGIHNDAGCHCLLIAYMLSPCQLSYRLKIASNGDEHGHAREFSQVRFEAGFEDGSKLSAVGDRRSVFLADEAALCAKSCEFGDERGAVAGAV